MPALALMNPSRCSVIRTPRALREIDRLSRRINSTRRGSLPTSAASSSACGPGSTVSNCTSRPSALETILDVTTSTSPDCRCRPAASSPSRMIRTRSSPGSTSGMPGRAVMVKVAASTSLDTRDADAAIFDSIFVVDEQQHRRQRLHRDGIVQRPGMDAAHPGSLCQFDNFLACVRIIATNQHITVDLMVKVAKLVVTDVMECGNNSHTLTNQRLRLQRGGFAFRQLHSPYLWRLEGYG